MCHLYTTIHSNCMECALDESANGRDGLGWGDQHHRQETHVETELGRAEGGGTVDMLRMRKDM